MEDEEEMRGSEMRVPWRILQVWFLVGLLFIFCGAWSFASTEANFSVNATPDNLTLTLTTDNDNYASGQDVQISGTVKNLDNTPVESGTTVITLSCKSWNRQIQVQVDNGSYSYLYPISFGDPEGTWTIAASAVDENGNTGTCTDNFVVSSPENTIFYTIEFLSPPSGTSYSRGDEVPISVRVVESGALVENIGVSCNSPSGENLNLTTTTTGIYSTTYSLAWDCPVRDWCISVEGRRTVDNSLKAGGSYIKVEVKPAVLELELLSPADREVVVGESVEIRVRVSYSDSIPLEGATVSVTTPTGESLTLEGGDNGVYWASYSISSENTGNWTMQVAATDPDGNLGSCSYVISVVYPFVSIAIFLALTGIGIAAGIVAVVHFTRKRTHVGRLEAIKKEKSHITRLQTEAATEYFKKGAISRETYDTIIREHAGRIAELERLEKQIEKYPAKRGVPKKGLKFRILETTEVEPRKTYLIETQDRDKGFQALEKLSEHDLPCLCFTGTYPEDIRKNYLLGKTKIIWLSKRETEGSISPSNPEMMSEVISKFMEKHKRGAILLDGLESLIVFNGFETILRFVQDISEKVSLRGHILLIPFDPRTLEDQQTALLERNAVVIKIM